LEEDSDPIPSFQAMEVAFRPFAAIPASSVNSASSPVTTPISFVSLSYAY
jgi:hypothetical protein